MVQSEGYGFTTEYEVFGYISCYYTDPTFKEIEGVKELLTNSVNQNAETRIDAIRDKVQLAKLAKESQM